MNEYNAEDALKESAVNTRKREMSFRVLIAMIVLGGFFSFAATYADMTTGIFSGWAFMFVSALIVSRYFAWIGEHATKQELGLILAGTPALSSATIVFWIQFATSESVLDAGITLPTIVIQVDTYN